MFRPGVYTMYRPPGHPNMGRAEGGYIHNYRAPHNLFVCLHRVETLIALGLSTCVDPLKGCGPSVIMYYIRV